MSSRPAQRSAKPRPPARTASNIGPKTAAQTRPKAPVKQVHEIVDPRWVLKALGLVVLVALLCAQALVWWVFSRTQWQYVLKPSRAVAVTPQQYAAQHGQTLLADEVHFGVDATGQPQLDGWWISADGRRARQASPAATALLLHSGNGSMSDALPSAMALHDAGLDVMLFDYRGYGRSGGRHPSEATMETDAETALEYVESTRGVSPRQIIVYGIGVGASLATTLCAVHPDLAGLVLLNAKGDLRSEVQKDPRVRLVPVGLLFHEDFPLAKPLASLTTPKLLLSTETSTAPVVFLQARDPKTTVELASSDAAAMQSALKRFLDGTIASAAPALKSDH